ncbi:MAG: S1C family serine protease, partial [Verrucomicrobiota bacterium]
KGFGLVVRSVDPKSRIHDKLKQYDILLKLDEQHLISSEQLTVLVSSFEPGRSVKLELIRQGKRGTMTVQLSGRPPLPLEAEKTNAVKTVRGPLAVPPGFKLPDLEQVDRTALDPNLLKALQLDQLPEPHREALLRDFGTRFVNPGNANGMNRSSSQSYTLIDNGTSISMTTLNGRSRLMVRDPRGTVVFDGPVNTDEERARVPKDIRKKLFGIEKVTGSKR